MRTRLEMVSKGASGDNAGKKTERNVQQEG